MRAAQIVEYGAPLDIREIPDPTPESDGVVLAVQAAGICRSDWHAWMGDWGWLGGQVALPRTLGHELVGEVVAVGPEVRSVRIGDRVTVPFHLACGTCGHCRDGRANVCDNMQVLGFWRDGGYAEYVSIPTADFNCVPVPEGLTPVAASAIGCRFMTAFHAVLGQGEVRPGDRVAVHGVGGVGLSAVQIASAAGAFVVAVDIDPAKLALAKEQGAAHTIDAGAEPDVPAAVREATDGGAHVSIDALGARATVLNSIRCLRKRGRHVQVGMTGAADAGEIALPIDEITIAELSVVGSHGNPHTSYPRLLSLVASGRLAPQTLVQRTVALEQAGDVLAAMSDFTTGGGITVIDRFGGGQDS
ncbi:zinc-dependent alcohol dehydrogenase family protein [Nocardia sp. CDC159]|uniref:Zinc-dependent alcohol dehydrogenase family protein n=1 Tax=Nocardia pulmonis TaxID=2951408 RepID=A0A9X2EHE3_9NOCA|nr:MULTISPECIES: zinc-dependent alcohol dehydrogenase family protein [Nocardia]MCM6778288.1 zinc-dependent alcohol dehydrogenase family protein [Nocardia pulmonis]MCM6791177.1 zinc-dependent alcohol dehydrogenase family protein [Nocardia sp. CDC159]